LGEAGLLAPPGRVGTERFWTSGEPTKVAAVMERLWGAPLALHPLTREAATPLVGEGAALIAQGAGCSR
jgi:glutamate racemase